MHNVTIFFNCHGNYLSFYLKKYLDNNIYKINFIYIADFDGGGGTRKYFKEEEINIFKNTDILIVQYIKNDREFINHDKIIKLTKKDTIVIKIPHYTYQGYNYKGLSDKIIKNIDNSLSDPIYKKKIYDDLNKYLFNSDTLNSFYEFQVNQLENIKTNDEFSDIKIYNIFKNNYKKKILFNEPWHPNSYFCYLLVIEILKKLNLEHNFEYIETFEIFSQTQFNINNRYLIYYDKMNNFFNKEEISENIKNGKLLLYKKFLNNDINFILYEKVNIKNINIDKIEIIHPYDNILKIITFDKEIFYISVFTINKIDLVYYIYFHSKLLLNLNEVNSDNLDILIKHPACSLLNSTNIEIIKNLNIN